MASYTRREFVKTTAAAASLAAVSSCALPCFGLDAEPPASKCQVACYYFPNYHLGDPRNEKNKGRGWNEWELIKAAKPRFPKHDQPKKPLWGYTDEADPKVMAQKIDAAADHGIDAFIFDWYYYNDGPFLQRGLEKGFLAAPNNRRLKFALMWANHDWLEIQPRKLNVPEKVLYPGRVSPEAFDKMADYVIAKYFKHPSYWLLDGRPYFSVYELSKLLESFGSVSATRAALDHFRDKARAAGLPGLHLNAVIWGTPILPGENRPANMVELVEQLGFDSVTSYVWIHHVTLPQWPATSYDYVQQQYMAYWRKIDETYKVPYYPNVTMGWDASPRANQSDLFGNYGYPFMATISGNTPQRFKAALEATKQRLLSRPPNQRVLTLNSWNEWTEGSYLEPDTVHKMQYLQAVREVFGKN
jgi:hypothetical protein